MAQEESKTRREPVEIRTRRVLDEILPLVEAMGNPKGKLALGGLLNEVGSEYERHGPTTAEVLVAGKYNDASYSDKRDDMQRLRQIINIIQREGLPRTEGGFILKKLDAIRDFYQ